jgi:hypothetical protein
MEYARLQRFFPRSRWYRDYFLVDFDRCSTRRVAMVQGACFLFRAALLAEIGGLDERFFLYFEETDFCKRASDRGWHVDYVGEASAMHWGSHSMPGGRQDQFIRSLYRYHRKHGGLAAATLLWLVLTPYHAGNALHLAMRGWFDRQNDALRADRGVAVRRFLAHLALLR